MFNNAGKKLMTVVQVIFWLLAVFGILLIIVGVVVAASGSGVPVDGAGFVPVAPVGIGIVLVGVLLIIAAYIQCLFYAAFAQLSKDVHDLAKKDLGR